MSEHLDRNELEELLRSRSEPGFMAAMITAMEDLPMYVRDLGMLRTALASLEDVASGCSCGKPDCLAAPHHKEMYQERLDAALAGLREASEEIFQAILDMAWKVGNCQCVACQNADKQAHAWLN